MEMLIDEGLEGAEAMYVAVEKGTDNAITMFSNADVPMDDDRIEQLINAINDKWGVAQTVKGS
jgi:hypothetical protein